MMNGIGGMPRRTTGRTPRPTLSSRRLQMKVNQKQKKGRKAWAVIR